MATERPAPIVPMPAARFPRLRGRRVIVGVPGVGFRGDLRADDPVVHGSRTYIPVLSEQDYYRAETEQLEVFATLVPVERVWVEHASAQDAPAEQPATIDSPGPRIPVLCHRARDLVGRRVVQAVLDGHIRDLRAVTDVYVNAEGLTCARICGEVEWYRWALSGQTPATIEVSAADLWIE